MNILHIAPVRFNNSSGLSVVIPKIITYQNKLRNINAGLLNISNVSANINEDSIEFDYFRFDKQNFYNLEKLPIPYNKPDIVILHSVFQYKTIFLVRDLINKKIPYVIFPHGGMTSNALLKSSLKKKIASKLFFSKIVENSSKIQYLTEGEAYNSSAWDKDYYINGNGVEIPVKKKTNSRTNKLRINYIGRLDINIKGLDLLLDASMILKSKLLENQASINIYGPSTNNSAQHLNNIIKNNDLSEVVNIHGPVYDEEKEEILVETDIFIQLSRSEGLPTGVLEALSYGIPCLLTPGTNLADEVENNKCGWKTETTPNAIAEKLNYILSNYSKSAVYSHNAIEFIRNNYSWETITLNAINEYSKIIKNYK